MVYEKALIIRLANFLGKGTFGGGVGNVDWS